MKCQPNLLDDFRNSRNFLLDYVTPSYIPCHYIQGADIKLPEISHLQFVILDILYAREQSGRHVREKLGEAYKRKSSPAFYQLMARMEEAKFVTGRYQAIEVEGQAAKERLYKITGSGRKAFDETRKFYASRDAAHRGGERAGAR